MRSPSDEWRGSGPSATFDVLKRHVSPGLALSYKFAGSDAVEEYAEGALVRLSDGREVVDFGSYAVMLLGHRHPAIIEAVRYQLERMPTATRSFANPVVAEFIEALLERCGSPLKRVWLGSDGADAVEVAVKLARRRTGRPRILAVKHAFHGKTLGAVALTWNPAFRVGLERHVGHVTHVCAGDPEAVRREVEAGDVAALIVEPIQGEGGVRPLDPAVLRRWSADVHGAGGFLISDEIQAGLRRCGPLSPAVALDLKPDAVLFGKALGGGIMPLAAMVATAELQQPLAADPTWHSATFGGHPLACAAGRAALTAIDELAERAEAIARRFQSALYSLASEHREIVIEFRGAGLMWGIEFATPALAGTVLTQLVDRGLLVSPCLSSVRTIRLLPPMVVTDEQLDHAFDVLSTTLAMSS
jgi:putrescine aminotransferase